MVLKLGQWGMNTLGIPRMTADSAEEVTETEVHQLVRVAKRPQLGRGFRAAESATGVASGRPLLSGPLVGVKERRNASAATQGILT